MANTEFPSLSEEGSEGGGYDVRLRMGVTPLLLQFKLSEGMGRSSAAEWDLFGTAYYRFRLHSRKRSRQHSLLLAHEQRGNDVYYVAPAYHKDHEFHAAFFAGLMERKSVFVSPSEIGQMTDDDSHVVAFQAGSDIGYFRSKPRRIKIAARGDDAGRKLIAHSRRAAIDRASKSLESRLADLRTVISEVLGLRDVPTGGPLAGRSPLIQHVYLVRTYLGAEPLFVPWASQTA